MGSFIQDVKVTCDLNNGRDQEFKFKVVVKDTADLIKTVNVGLRQKIEEGELIAQNVREYRIKTDDKQGFFESVAGDVKDLLNV